MIKSIPKSCAECDYKKYHNTLWECGLESDDITSVDIGEPFNYVPKWCKLRQSNTSQIS